MFSRPTVGVPRYSYTPGKYVLLSSGLKYIVVSSQHETNLKYCCVTRHAGHPTAVSQESPVCTKLSIAGPSDCSLLVTRVKL